MKINKTLSQLKELSKKMRTNEIKIEIDEIKKLEEKLKKKDLKYETRKIHI